MGFERLIIPSRKSDYVRCHLKQELSLDLIKHHAIKAYGRMEVELHTGIHESRKSGPHSEYFFSGWRGGV